MKVQQMARQASHLGEKPKMITGSENSSQSSGSSSGKSSDLFSSSTSSPEQRKSRAPRASLATQKLPVSPTKILQEEARIILHIDMVRSLIMFKVELCQK